MSLPPELQAALLGKRVVFLRGRLDSSMVNSVIGQLLLVAHTAAGETVELYVDSPGGSLSAALALYDVVQTLGSPVSTTCTGTAGGASALILAGGAAGRRFALPHARVHLRDEPPDLPTGTANEVAGQAQEAARVVSRWREALAGHASCSPRELAGDLRAGRWLSATEAQHYGIVDDIVTRQQRSAH